MPTATPYMGNEAYQYVPRCVLARRQWKEYGRYGRGVCKWATTPLSDPWTSSYRSRAMYLGCSSPYLHPYSPTYVLAYIATFFLCSWLPCVYILAGACAGPPPGDAGHGDSAIEPMTKSSLSLFVSPSGAAFTLSTVPEWPHIWVAATFRWSLRVGGTGCPCP